MMFTRNVRGFMYC